MAFDRRWAERTLVDVLPGGEGSGMGFRLLDNLIATACHCLPHRDGKLVLPEPFYIGDDPVEVLIRRHGAPVERASRDSCVDEAMALVTAADPCSDLAILSSSTASGRDLPDGGALDRLIDSLESARPDLVPRRDIPVFIFTHEDRWIEATAKASFVYVENPADRIRPGTSGAPVFNEDGLVVGIVSSSNQNGPDARMCLLADHLPGWVLRLAAEPQGDLETLDSLPPGLLESLRKP
jgi:hypothetical protein